MTWELNDEDVTVSEPKPQGYPSHTPLLKQRTPNTGGGLSECRARDYRFTVAVTEGLAVHPDRPAVGVRVPLQACTAP